MASAAGAAAYGVAAGAGAGVAAAARTPARAMVAVQAVERMTSSTSFSIMHWNVLADGLAQSGNFLTPDGHKKDPALLEWAYRQPYIEAEVKAANPDIICMVELNKSRELNASFKRLGYSSHIFVPKTHSPAVLFGATKDGVGMWWKPRFKLLDRQQVPFMRRETGELQGQRGLVVVLEDSKRPSGDNVVVIGAAHLKAKHGFDVMRQLQLRQLTYQAHRLASAATRGTDARAPVVIVGDFNDTPGSLAHTLMLQAGYRSAYSRYNSDKQKVEEPRMTTWKYRPKAGGVFADDAGGAAVETKEQKRCIDYIWCSPANAVTAEIVPLATWSILKYHDAKGLPYAHYPSDHVALVAELDVGSF